MFLLVTGGSGSGKSACAENRLTSMEDGQRIYLATMAVYDEESRRRIARHRAMRADKQFVTVERPLDLAGVILPEKGSGEGRSVLLECMSNLTANEMFDPAGSGKRAFEAVCGGVEYLLAQSDNLVVVTNEIFSDGILYDEQTRAYQKLLGRVNAWMGEMADEVVEVICGIPVTVKERES